jgi:hypothetical protein
MKKLMILTLMGSTFWMSIFSQTTIQYSVHALKTGVDNPMSYCNYVAPGAQGENISWDFSGLSYSNSFTGYVTNSQLSDNQVSFPMANTELTEFGSRFYFNVNEHQIEQYGYTSADRKTKVIYTVPFIKMKYPFAYGDSYSGSFSGIYEYADLAKGDITGTYSVEADAYGTLILPDNNRFENVLRIKTIKVYDNRLKNSLQHVEITTFRWYCAYQRYPLLVLTKATTSLGSSEYKSLQAAYNNNAAKLLKSKNSFIVSDDMELFPNPVTSSLTLKADALSEGTLHLEIYDVSGKFIKAINLEIFINGTQMFDLTEEISDLKPAFYLMVIKKESIQKTISFAIIE